jgi:hypothetical protein
MKMRIDLHFNLRPDSPFGMRRSRRSHNARFKDTSKCRPDRIPTHSNNGDWYSVSDNPEGTFSTVLSPVSLGFTDRVRQAYRKAIRTSGENRSPLWSSIASRSQYTNQLLTNESYELNVIREYLSNPGSNYLFYGFDNLFKDDLELLRSNINVRNARVLEIRYMIGLLAEAIGAVRFFNGEFGVDHPNMQERRYPLEEKLAQIIRTTGDIKFQSAFPDGHGVMTTHGLVSHRSIHAVYGAWKAKKLSAEFGPNVVEIGAGLGRSAMFSYQLGMTDYTIIDIPLTAVSQAMFLGHALGEDNVTLTGEEPKPDAVAIVSPGFFQELDRSVSLVINVDSLTEMSLEDATGYAEMAKRKNAPVLSINHEANDHTVRQVLGAHFQQKYRAPYWLRSGYVEELYLPR